MSETPGWLTLPTMVHREDLDKAVAAAKDLRAALDRAEAETKACGDREVAAWAARDQYIESNTKLTEMVRALRAELNDKSNQIVELQTELERRFNLEAELATAEAESDRLRAAYNDVRALNAQITFNLGAELAAMREERNTEREITANLTWAIEQLQDENAKLKERLGPRGLEVVEINGTGHYVNEKVKLEIDDLRKRVEGLDAWIRDLKNLHGAELAAARSVLIRVDEWWTSLPYGLRQDIEGSGAAPGCIAAVLTALQSHRRAEETT